MLVGVTQRTPSRVSLAADRPTLIPVPFSRPELFSMTHMQHQPTTILAVASGTSSGRLRPKVNQQQGQEKQNQKAVGKLTVQVYGRHPLTGLLSSPVAWSALLQRKKCRTAQRPGVQGPPRPRTPKSYVFRAPFPAQLCQRSATGHSCNSEESTGPQQRRRYRPRSTACAVLARPSPYFCDLLGETIRDRKLMTLPGLVSLVVLGVSAVRTSTMSADSMKYKAPP
jgi:hypothetical protein